MNDNVRDRRIGEIIGKIYNPELGYGLSDWFELLQEKKLKDIKDEDISRLIRQGLLINYAVLEGARRLLDNPVIGLYDGEVLAEISKLSQDFWLHNEDLRNEFKKIVYGLEDHRDTLESFDWQCGSCKNEFWDNIEMLKRNVKGTVPMTEKFPIL